MDNRTPSDHQLVDYLTSNVNHIDMKFILIEIIQFPEK